VTVRETACSIPERLKRYVHDKVLYKSTFSLPYPVIVVHSTKQIRWSFLAERYDCLPLAPNFAVYSAGIEAAEDKWSWGSLYSSGRTQLNFSGIFSSGWFLVGPTKSRAEPSGITWTPPGAVWIVRTQDAIRSLWMPSGLVKIRIHARPSQYHQQPLVFVSLPSNVCWSWVTKSHWKYVA